MSRAFVDEDAGSDETDGMHDIPLPLPPGAKNYMTPDGAMRMADELRNLVDLERPQAAGALAAAAPAAKSEYLRRVSEIDRRISYLSRMKSILTVVDSPSSVDHVVFGLVVRVREEGSADSVPRDVEYRIVGVDESDPEKGYVSWASPVAKALIGKKVGDIVSAHLPLGERMMKILGVRFAEPGR